MSNHAPVAVIAGVSLGSYQRSAWRPARDGWEIEVVPGRQHGHGNVKGIWERILRLADECADETDAGVHFILAHDREGERPTFRRDLRERSLRAVWLRRSLSRQYGSNDFRRVIDDVLGFEEQWRGCLRPDVKSPLLLPESAFDADPSVRDTWLRAHDVVVEHDNIDAVGQSIRLFGRVHRRESGWLDSRRLRFKRGAPHGMHGLPGWRTQKFGLRLPSGFHFDVNHERGKSFRLSDQNGARHRFDAYTNVDPHGFIRGGD